MPKRHIITLGLSALITACLPTNPNISALQKHPVRINAPTPSQPWAIQLKNILKSRLKSVDIHKKLTSITINLSRPTWTIPHPSAWNGLASRTLSYAVSVDLEITQGKQVILNKKNISISQSIILDPNQFSQPSDIINIQKRLNNKLADAIWKNLLTAHPRNK